MSDEALASKTDAQLVLAMGSVEVEALAEAYDRHGQSVYDAGVRLCGQQQAAVMTQEVFLALWHSPTEFVKPGACLRETLVADIRRRAVMFLQTQHSHRGAESVEKPRPRAVEADGCP